MLGFAPNVVAHAGHRKAYRCGAPAPFSPDQGCRRRMKRPSTSRNFCVPRLAASLSVLLSNQSLFSTPHSHPYRITVVLPATVLLAWLGAVLSRASLGPRQTYSSSIELA